MLEHIFQIQPKSILDIGAGFGKWGYLCRDLLDFNQGHLDADSWRVTIDGVEVFAYDSPLHDWVYDRIIRSNITESVDVARGYDLVILGDVIEHFAKREGESLLQSLIASNRHVLISTPTTFFTQEIAGNPYEAHQSLWGPGDFRALPADIDIVGGAMVVLIAGANGSFPSTKQARASSLAVRLPIVRHRGMLLRLAKRALKKLPA